MGSSRNVDFKIPMGEGVIVILMVSSISACDMLAWHVIEGKIVQNLPEMTHHPSGSAKCVNISPLGVIFSGIPRDLITAPFCRSPKPVTI